MSEPAEEIVRHVVRDDRYYGGESTLHHNPGWPSGDRGPVVFEWDMYEGGTMALDFSWAETWKLRRACDWILRDMPENEREFSATPEILGEFSWCRRHGQPLGVCKVAMADSPFDRADCVPVDAVAFVERPGP